MSLVPCRHCGIGIAAAATSCPRCGGPAPRRTSAFTWVVAIVLGLPCIAGVVVSSYQSTTRPSPAVAAISATESRWREMQAEPLEKTQERKDLVRRILETGAIRKVERRPTGTTIHVGPSFYEADFDTKNSLVSVIVLDAWREEKQAVIARLVDVRTGKKIGLFSVSDGLSLD